jgi:hypothetical protein
MRLIINCRNRKANFTIGLLMVSAAPDSLASFCLAMVITRCCLWYFTLLEMCLPATALCMPSCT